MISIDPLRGWFAARKISQQQIANVLQKDASTVNRKMNRKSDWTSTEIALLHKRFNVPIGLFIR